LSVLDNQIELNHIFLYNEPSTADSTKDPTSGLSALGLVTPK